MSESEALRLAGGGHQGRSPPSEADKQRSLQKRADLIL